MFKYNDDLKLVQRFKNCQKWVHIKMCQFHSKMKELAKSDIMYAIHYS